MRCFGTLKEICAGRATVMIECMFAGHCQPGNGGCCQAFSAAHPDAGIASFPFAMIQRGFLPNYGALGFVNAESGCASDLAVTHYSTGNLYRLAGPTFTAEGAKVCAISFSHGGARRYPRNAHRTLTAPLCQAWKVHYHFAFHN